MIELNPALKRILYLIFILSLIACNPNKIKSRYPDGKMKELWVYSSFSVNKFWICQYYHNGIESFQGRVENNKFVGERYYYYNNGKIKEIYQSFDPCNFDQSNCNDSGILKKYSINGWLKEIVYKKNRHDGFIKTFDSLGRITTWFSYSHFKKNGLFEEFFENNITAFRANYLNDTINGYGIFFYATGDTLKLIQYHNNEMSFPYKKWLSNGLTLEGNFSLDSSKAIWVWKNRKGTVIKRKTQLFNGTSIAPD